jgi:16S rRNA processing protein RimM
MPPPMIVMGRVIAAFGVRGSLKIAPLSSEPDALAAHRTWYLRRTGDGAWQRRDVKEARLQGSALVADLDGVASREAALAWRGAEVAVPRDALPPIADDEIYAADLEGFRVVNREGVALGRVRRVTEAGAHPLLEVEHDGGLRLVPYVPAIVVGVDREAATIEVEWGEDY